MSALQCLRQTSCILRGLRVVIKEERVRALTTRRRFTTTAAKMDELKENHFFNKYAEKLKKKQTENPEEFEQKVSSVVEKHKKELEDKKKALEEHQAKLREDASQIKPGSLDQVMKVDLLKDKTHEEITELWVKYHKDKDCVFAILTRDEYEEIYRRSKEFGTFVYPIPRGTGYEFFLQQFAGNTVNFTPLIQFQAHKENAPMCLTLTHYTELMEDKDIVLMRGEPDTKVMSVHEAQLLALQVKMYYGLQSGMKFNMVRLMNNSPDNFRHMDMIKQFENFKKDSRLAKEVSQGKMSESLG